MRPRGKKTLLKIAVVSANYLCGFIGDAPKHNIVCEHSLCEEALLNLYRLFIKNPELAGELQAVPQEYKRLSRYFIDHKGDNETRYTFPKYLQEYAQDHRPAKEQREAVGHAVRATLFYSAMADTVYEDDDEELFTAVRAIWQDIVETKFHANGSVGAFSFEEKFGQQYDLPNNAYLETCAGVGMIFFGANMAKLTGRADIFDTVECAVYNVLRASVSESFDHYTYQNPLETSGGYARWEWHKCPCCPPMLLKAVGMLPTLIYSLDDEKVLVNLYIDSELKSGDVHLTQRDGKIVFEKDLTMDLALRIPAWARDFRVLCGGKEIGTEAVNGYAVVKRHFRQGEVLEVSCRVPLVKYAAHPYVKSDIGKVMIKRGSVLYCAESIDIEGYSEWTDFDISLAEESPLELCADQSIRAQRTDGTSIRLIPYYQWNNRGSLPMRVWLNQAGLTADQDHIEGWEHLLYRPYREYDD